VCIVTSPSAERRQANTFQSFLHVAAPQIELGSATTSYIPTTDAEATRAADVVQSDVGLSFLRVYGYRDFTRAAGPAGAKGVKDDPGAAGAAGAKRDKGDPGTVGATGVTGAKGDKEDPGAASSARAKGDKCYPAAVGATGAKRDTCDPVDAGATGAKRDKGDPGASARRV